MLCDLHLNCLSFKQVCLSAPLFFRSLRPRLQASSACWRTRRWWWAAPTTATPRRCGAGGSLLPQECCGGGDGSSARGGWADGCLCVCSAPDCAAPTFTAPPVPQDLYDTIASGDYPEWKLFIQTMDPAVRARVRECEGCECCCNVRQGGVLGEAGSAASSPPHTPAPRCPLTSRLPPASAPTPRTLTPRT